MPTILIALLAVAGLVFSGAFKTGIGFVDALKFQINPLQIPSISKGNLEFPLTVSIINPSSITMPLDSVFASIYKKEGTEWKYLGSSQPDLTDVEIKANATSKLNFTIKIPLLSAGSELLEMLNVNAAELLTTALTNPGSLLKVFSNAEGPKKTYKIETRIVVEGQPITQNFEAQL